MVLGKDGEKMSKSRGNVIAPDDLVQAYGADTVRAYLMFFKRWEQGGPWEDNIDGIVRWIRRSWTVILEPVESAATAATAETIRSLRRKVHQTLRSVTRDYEVLEFNTIISSLMELMNEMSRAKQQGAWQNAAWDEAVDIYLKMLAPLAPHISEELWERLGKPYSIHQQTWPVLDEAATVQEEMTLAVQVNGKVRDHITMAVDAAEEEVKAKALSTDNTQKFLEGKKPRQVIYVPGRLVNIVV